jgi:pimeloyl-ACP methyl ester carboxylesterase
MSDAIMNHIREGAGDPPIVFVHGYLCELNNWRHQIAHFKATNTVLACDLRGLGQTPLGDGEMSIEQMGQDVADLLAHHDLKGAVLVGHSMGCRVIMEANRRAKDRVGGLVLVDGSRGGQNRSPDQAKFDKAIAENGYAAFVGTLFEGMFFGDAPGWKAAALQSVFDVPEGIGKPLYRNLIAWDAEQLDPALAAIDVPVLVLQSTYMNLERKRLSLGAGEVSPYQEMVCERVANTKSATIPAGHFTMIEEPEATNAEIAKFMDRMSA